MTRFNKGTLIALAGTLVWSTTAIFIRYLSIHYRMPPFVLAFWRDGLLAFLMGIAFLLFSRKRLHLPAGTFGFILLYGFVLSIFNSAWTISVQLNGAAVSTVLAYGSSAFTAIFGWILFKERLDWVKIVAVLASIAGCILVAGAYDPATWKLNPLGAITGLSSGVFFAVYSLMGKSSTNRGINSWTALFYSFGIGSLFILMYAQLPLTYMGSAEKPSIFWLGNAWGGWLLLLALSLGPTLGGYGLYTLSMNYLPASNANLIATLEPALTAIQSYFLLGERFSLMQIVGSLLVLFGVIFIQVMENRRVKQC